MKKLLLAASLLLVSANAQAVETSSAAKYDLDHAHTNVIWFADHFGYSHPFGYFKDIDGNFWIDQAHPENSKVDVTIKTTSLATPIDKLTEHLQTKDFLDTAKFPEAKFMSTKVEVTGKDTANVTGNFTLHGVTKPIVLAVKLNAIGQHPFNHKEAAGFSATATFKRSDFGVDAYLPSNGGSGVGDDIRLVIETEGFKTDGTTKTQ